MAIDVPGGGAVLTGGWDGLRSPDESAVRRGPAAEGLKRGSAAGPWPEWARRQLAGAVAIAEDATDRMSVAALLYREWFNPVAGDVRLLPKQRPLAGLYRAAHAGSATRVRRGGVSVVARHDVIRAGGWWRTWGENWTPPRNRPGSVRLLMTPRPDRLAEFVATVTGRLLTEQAPWSLACAIDPRRLSRSGCAVLDLPALDAVPADLVADLEPLLRPVVPPLCLPLAAGVGAAEYPDNGMTFGEHRCHLVALALRHPSSARQPLRAVAVVFNAHGIDPAHPHRSR
jgi:hypothetical protein